MDIRVHRRQQRERVAEAITPDGEALTLDQLGEDFEVRVGRETLMSSRQRGSEEMMAELALPGDRADATPATTRVLVGGLGMGFTLRAVLDRLAGNAVVEVAELLPAVVQWNEGVLRHLADAPLEDARTRVRQVDVQACIAEAVAEPARRYHAVLLDVDNGPQAFTVRANHALYAHDGLSLLREALVPGGLIVVWSAFRSPRFERALRNAGLEARSVGTRARGTKGARHTLFVGRRLDSQHNARGTAT